MKRAFLLFIGILLFTAAILPAQLTVTTAHPRILLDPTTKTTLLTKKSNNDPDWLALKAEADDYASRMVLSWSPANAGIWDDDYIFYNYCGSSWDDATLALGLAHQLTKGNATGAFPTAYSDQLLELADTILAGYDRYPPCSGCSNMFLFNTTYATRHLGPVIGTIYDWCYDELGPTRKAALIALMEDFFNYMRVPLNVYQNTDNPTGNYYFGHVLCAAYFGYATMYDSPLAQEMIDFARQRVLGTHSGSLSSNDLANNWLKQSYTGGLPTGASSSYLGPASYTVAPQKDGIPVQGWGYSGGTLSRLIDYCHMVRSASGEAIADSLYPFFSSTLAAFAHALTPNRFQLDNSNDWGSFVGNFLSYGLPLRMAAVLQGSPLGPQAQYFYTTWIQPVSIAATWNDGYPAANWEKLLYADPSRPATAFSYPPYYPAISTPVYTSVPIDQTIPKYYMRSDWSDTATWAALNMSSAFYDDHDHHNAGHFQIIRGDQHDGDDLLLVGANEVGDGGAFGTNGIEGGTCYHMSSSLSNTLFIDDHHDYAPVNSNGYTVGGQSFYGYDEPTHIEQNDSLTYVRADLTSAYFRRGEIADTVNRAVRYFHRNFLYLRDANLFFSYDQFRVKNSTHPQGQYRKHLRWHFLEEPNISGNHLTATMGNSKLYVHTVLPASIDIQKVNESNNPDNTFGPTFNYAFNTYTWRAEVSTTGDPLKQDILTVFQPGSLSAVEMNSDPLQSTNGNMEGGIISVDGRHEVVLFNRDNSKYPTPIDSTAYTIVPSLPHYHTLVGMVPGGSYSVDVNGFFITVVRTTPGAGTHTASPAGVLRFKPSFVVSTPAPEAAEQISINTFPNPSTGSLTCTWTGNARPDQLLVTNVHGQVIQHHSLSAARGQHGLQLSTQGIYFITFKSKSRTLATHKVVITQ